MKRAAAILCCLYSSAALAQTGFYLSPTGVDTNDCHSAATACATVAHVESLAAAGDVVHFAAGVYRLTNLANPATAPTAGRIVAKDGQTFTGPPCIPGTAACSAILDGSVQLGTFAGPDVNNDYTIAGPSTTHGGHGCYPCVPGWGGCNFPEELFWDGALLQHAGETLAGSISYVSVTGGTITGTGTCTTTANSGNGNGAIATGTIAINGGVPTGTVTVSSFTDCGTVPTSWTLSGGASGATCASSAATGPPIMTTSGGALQQPTLSASSWWYDYTNNVIYVGASPIGHKVETSVTLSAFAPGSPQANQVTVENLTVQKFASQNQQGGGINAAYGQTSSATSGIDWVVQNDYVALNHGNGIRAGFGMQIIGNVVTMNGQLGIGGGLPAAQGPSRVVVQGNVVTGNNTTHMSPGFGAGGIKFGNTADAVVRGNTVSTNNGNGIHFDVNSINPLIDGNTVVQNVDTAATAGGIGSGTAIIFEIGNGGATIRNNYVQFIGAGGAYGLQSSTSEGAIAYCNVVEEMPGISNDLWKINAGPRGDIAAPPNADYCPTTTGACTQMSRGNSFHHNTFIWDAGATGTVGFAQHDAANQPDFFALNTAPDDNWYHLSPTLGTGAAKFVYDDDDSESNTPLSFTMYQARGADLHGSVDTVDADGFPMVSIASPIDQASYDDSAQVTVTASDASGIAKVELYVDWKLYATLTTAPYQFTLSGLADGSHTVAALAYATSTVIACNAITLTSQSTLDGGTASDGGDGGNGGDGGPADDAGAAPPPVQHAGCSCRVSGAGSSDAAPWMSAVLFALALSIRRRGKRQPSEAPSTRLLNGGCASVRRNHGSQALDAA